MLNLNGACLLSVFVQNAVDLTQSPIILEQMGLLMHELVKGLPAYSSIIKRSEKISCRMWSTLPYLIQHLAHHPNAP